MAGPVIEREVKLQAPPHFALPDLAVRGLVPEVVPVAELVASYYDTPSLRLARWGMTARYRIEPGRAGWAVKVPVGQGDALTRREVAVAGEPGAPPKEVLDLVAGVTRGELLGLVATVTTERRAVRLVDDHGNVVAEVVDDEVVVSDAGANGTTFREVEVELGAGAENGVLRAVRKRLERAGARPPDPTPKVFRALPSRPEPEVPAPEVGSGASVGELVTAALRRHVRRLVLHLPGLVVGDDPEDVHQVRVATRRLRADLRTFRRYLADEETTAALREDLRTPAAALGAVRDDDVLSARLRADAAGFDAEESDAVVRLLRRLERRRTRHRAAARAALDAPDFLVLVDRLVALAQSPSLGKRASARARRAAPAIVAPPWRRVVAAVDDVAPLHLVRVAAKRARYAAEAVLPVHDAAGPLARRLAGVQDVLGEVQDAAVAVAWLRSVMPRLPADEAFAAGRLAALAEARAAAATETWRRQWPRVEKAAAWLR